MKKYIFMYNIDDEGLEQEIFENKLARAGIDFYIDDINIVPMFDDVFFNIDNMQYKKVTDEGNGLWVLEDHYLVAFTILNYELLTKTHWYNSEGYEVSDVLDWYDRHKDNEIFVSYKGVELVKG